MSRYSGSCLCTAVRFEIDAEFRRFYLCHCSYCRKDTGSAHAANLFAPGGSLTWLSGEDRVTRFTLPSTRHGKAFCSVCGSALPGLQMDGALLVVPAGSLDDEPGLRPTAHLFTASRASWDRDLADVPGFPGFPE